MTGADHDTRPVCAGAADRALLTIEAQRHAEHLLEQVRLGALDAEGLALELGRAYGIGLQALARSLCKAITGTSDVRP